MIRRQLLFLFFLLSGMKYAFSQSHDLNFYLQNGIQNSPLLKDYSNQLQMKKLDSLLIMAGKKISVSASGLVMIAPIINDIGYDEAITNKGQYTAVVTVNKTLFQKNYFNAQANQLHIQSDSIVTSIKISQRELEKAITDQYLSSYGNITGIKFQEQIISSLENQLSLLEPLVKNGIYLQTDYLTLKLQIQTEKINLQQLKDGYRSNLYTLNVLCGIGDTTNLEIEKPDLIWKTSSTYINPNLFLSSLDSASIEASKNLLRYNYVPKVDLFGDAGYNAIPAYFALKRVGFSAGVSFTWNLYDGGQKNLKLQQLSIRQTTNNFYKSNYRTQLTLQLANLEKKLQNSNSIISQWQQQLNDMNQLITMRRQQLYSGQLSIIDFLSAIRDYEAVQKSLNDAEISQQQIINEHNYLVW